MSKLKIVSFNIRSDYYGDGKNCFPSRAGHIFEKIEKEMPDIIGFQEVCEPHYHFLKRYLTGYTVIYNGRNEKFETEGAAFAFRNDTTELMKLDFFWYSETPNTPGSRYSNQSPHPRICQIGMFKVKGLSTPVWVYNNHLDYQNEEVVLLSAKQLMSRVEADNKIYPYPLFILGDFNSEPQTSGIKYFNSYAGLPVKDLTDKIKTTFHNYTPETFKPFKIDYIFTKKADANREHSVTVWDDSRAGIFLSDHYPVCLEIEL